MTKHPCGRVTYTKEEFNKMIPSINANVRASFEIEGHKITDEQWEHISNFAENNRGI